MNENPKEGLPWTPDESAPLPYIVEEGGLPYTIEEGGKPYTIDSRLLPEFQKDLKPANEFKPYVHRGERDITIYFKGDADYAETISDEITLYKSMDTHEVVGVRISK